MAILAQARHRWDGSVELEFPYNRGLVAALKADIPSNQREWVPERKVWIVDPPYAHIAGALFRSYFPDSTREPADRPTPIRTTDQLYRELHLLPTAPPYVVEAAYRAIAREEHPDRKPAAERDHAHERMIAINQAVETLRTKAAF